MHRTSCLTLSDITVLAPRQVNPLADISRDISAEYCEMLGIKPANYSQYTTMSAYLFPRTDLDRLVTIDILNNMLFYIDDYSTSEKVREKNRDDVEMRKVFVTCIDILRTGNTPPKAHRLYAPSMVLHERIQQFSSPALAVRLADSLEDHLVSITKSLMAIMNGSTPDVEGYILMRERDSGMYPTVDLVEFAYGIYIPEEVRQHPVIRRMILAVVRFCSLLNDMFSYHKEVILRQQRFNLVNVLMETRRLSFEEAVDETVRMINQEVSDFLDCEAKLPDLSFGDPELDRDVRLYAQGMRDQLIAGWHWQTMTNRYRSPESPFPELREMLPE
jgi:hypothetical protein